MDIFTKLPYLSLQISERVWLEDRKNEFSGNIEEFERRFLFSEGKSLHDRRFQRSGTKINNTSLAEHIEFDNVECCEYSLGVLESPLSPDGESLSRNSKIGLDVWKWNRKSAPLGYSPLLCTCPNLSMLYNALIDIYNGKQRVLEYIGTCKDPSCSGLLYIPYSLIEVPLDRKIDNAFSFTNYVKIPDNTDIYCGSLKHTLILCTTGKQHEDECLKAIKESGLSCYLVFDVIGGFDTIPFFTQTPEASEDAQNSTQNKALTLLLGDAEHDTAPKVISGQYRLTAHRLSNNKIMISSVARKQNNDFKPLTKQFFDTFKRSIPPDDDADNLQFVEVEGEDVIETRQIECNMQESFSKERKPLTLKLRLMPNEPFTSIEELLNISQQDILQDSTTQLSNRIDPEVKQNVMGNLYELRLATRIKESLAV